MPRIRQQLSTRVDLVQRIAALQEKIDQTSSEALNYARQIGELLLAVRSDERASLLRAAGVGQSSGEQYSRIARYWNQIEPIIAGHPAPSIREALKVIRKARLERPTGSRWPFLWPDWPNLYLASWRPDPGARRPRKAGRARGEAR